MRGPGSDPKGSSIWKGLLPLAKYRDYTPPVKTLARTIGHYQEWIAAAKGGAPATCSFEFSRRMTETALLGAISQRTGKTLDWDDGASRIANDSEAQQLVNPPYRSGWSL
jgi:hypothetical protein